jgi:hypothetical protein
LFFGLFPRGNGKAGLFRFAAAADKQPGFSVLMGVYGPTLPPLCVVAVPAIDALNPGSISVAINGGAVRQLSKFGVRSVVVAKLG